MIEALGHPVREHILAVLNERIASASEIGEELGADVSSFSDEDWRQIPATMRADLATRFIQAIIDDVTVALRSGTLTGRGDEHVSGTPADFDEAGWMEATELMTQTLGRLTAIQEESADRLAAGGGKRLSGTVGILAFETPSFVHSEGPNGQECAPEQTSRQASVRSVDP